MVCWLRRLDDSRYEPLWAACERLDLTVWVHGARSYITPDYAGARQSRYGQWASPGGPTLRFYLHHSAALEFFGPDHVLLGSDAPFGSLPGQTMRARQR